ncbi:MAG: VCBS repeat-containing protein [Planctomycetota bacterium]
MNPKPRSFCAALVVAFPLAAQRFVPIDQSPFTGYTTNANDRMFAADVDGDGDLDLLLSSGCVAINDGQHGFAVTAPGANIPTQPLGFPYGMHGVADVDGDGAVDLLTTRVNPFTPFSDLLVFRGNGQGTFAAPVVGGTANGLLLGSLVRDIDGDGNLDVFLVGFPGLALMRNAGNGQFLDESAARLPAALRTATHLPLDLADLDGDGDLDLLTGGHTTPMQLWRNDGAGNFVADAANNLAVYGLTLRAFFFDQDLDLDPDLVMFDDGTRTLRVLRNAAGVFTQAPVSLPATGRVHDLQVGDANGDARADLVLLTGSQAELSLVVGINQGASFAALPPVAIGRTIGQLPLDLAFVDLDGDADRDVVIGSRAIFLNDGLGALQPLTVVPAPRLVFGGTVHAADLDLDGDVDLAAGGQVLTGEGDGRFVDSGFALPGDGVARALFDADGDTDLDLVFTAVDNTLNDPFLSGLFVNQSGVFAAASFPSRVISGRVVTGDLDGDALPDLVAENGAVLRNIGGAFVLAATIPLAGPGPVAVVDFDGDLRLDVVLGTDLWRNGGGMAFQLSGQLPLSTLTSSIRELKAADLDQDGDVDLAAAITSSSFGGVFDSTVPLLLQGGVFTAGNMLLTGRASGGNALALSDVDGDGLVDVVDGSVWKNLGGASFQLLEALSVRDANSIAVADLDSDADADVLAAYGDAVIVQVNRQQQVRSPRVPILGDVYEVEFAVDGGWGGSSGLVLPLLALQRIPAIQLPGFGLLHVDPLTAFQGPLLVTGQDGTAMLSFTVPNDPALGGLDFYWQAVVQQGNALRLTGFWHERIVR